MLPKKIDKKHMGSHVPRLAFLPCKERVESSILFGSTNYLRFEKALVICIKSREILEMEEV